MKFQKIKTYALLLIIAAMAFTQFSCEADWLKEYDAVTLKDPATATVTVNTIKDSSAMLNYSLSTVGRIYVVVVPGTEATETPAASTILTLKTAGAVFKKQIILDDPAALSASVKITGLIQNTSYKVYALPVNEDGVQGTVATTDAFSTSDNYLPKLTISSGVSPSVSSAASQDASFKPVLTFSEPVVLDEGFVITVSYYNSVIGAVESVPVPKANISIASNKVTITLPKVPHFGQRLGITIGATSIKDRAGNFYAGVTSNIAATPYTGIYWRVKLAPTSMQQILPKDTMTSNLALKILVDFPLKMRKPNSAITGEGSYDPAKVVVRYSSTGITTDIQVPDSKVAIVNDTLVEITLPRTPVFGETVTFMMAEGAMRNAYGNPSAAIAFDKRYWFFSYGYEVSLITGNYSVLLTDNNNANVGSVNAAIAVVTKGDEIEISGLAKNIFGLAAETEPITGEFDGDFATIALPDWQPLFAANVGGKNGLVYFANRFSVDPVVGTVAANGNLSLAGWGFYFESTDGTVAGWLKRYNASAWTKGAKVSSSNVTEEFVIESFERKRR